MPPFVGEIRLFAGNFFPNGWAFCNGQQLPISENETLFQLIGTTYGGDGEETFNLPDLRGRLPMHKGNVHNNLGEMGGVEQVTLTIQQIPSHTHPFLATNDFAQQSLGTGLVPARSTQADPFQSDQSDPGAIVAMAPQSISPIGGSQPHENMQPYLCINYIISLFGEFPTQ